MSVGTKHADGLSGCLTQPVSMAFTTPRRSATTKRSRSWLPRPPTRRSSRSVANDSPGSASRRGCSRRRIPDRDEPASPAARAADIEDAFADPEIGAVMAYTGGDDQIRVLRHLDGDALAASPTRFFGYSDNDNLRLFLWNRGIVSYGSASTRTSSATPISTPTPSGTSVARCLRSRSAGSCPPTSGPTTGSTSRLASPASGTIPPARRWVGPEGDSAEPVRGRVWGGTFAIVKWHLQTDRYPGARPTRRGRPSRWRPRRTYRRRARSVGYASRDG